MSRFWKRDGDLEAELRAGARPRPDFVRAVVEGTRRREAGRRPSRRAALAVAMSGAMVMGLGATGALGAIGDGAKETAGAIKAALEPSSAGGGRGASLFAGPGRDQYGHVIKIGVCRATGSATNPYVFVTVPKGDVPGRAGRGDIVGVDSAADCPTVAPARPLRAERGGERRAAADRDQYGNVVKVGVCRRTGSLKKPYVFVTVPSADAQGRAGRGDIVGVASAADCPTAR